MRDPRHLPQEEEKMIVEEINERAETVAPKLTETEKEEILAELTEDPTEVVTYFGSLEDEAADSTTDCSFVVIERGDVWDVYSLETGPAFEGGLVFGGTYEDHEEALLRARDWAAETLEAAELNLSDQKDAEWDTQPSVTSGLAGPFLFQDSTDFQSGWELEDEDDVFDFFKRNSSLFNPEEWGNLYQCSLRDGNGTGCWVAMNHHGEMRLYQEG